MIVMMHRCINKTTYQIAKMKPITISNPMKTYYRLIAVINCAAAYLLMQGALGQITVGNIRATQRPATKLVDIDHDITGTGIPVKVFLEVSSDGGATWIVPAASVTGSVGSGILPGSNRRITWDADIDWNGRFSNLMQFRVTASTVPGVAAIPGGSFVMGSPVGEQGRDSDETQHPVTISSFSIERKEVTWSLWTEIQSLALSNGYNDLGNGLNGATGDASGNHPVTNITWWDVVKWCNLRSEIEGRVPAYHTNPAFTSANILRTGGSAVFADWGADGYRLPTEAEWEYACRAGTTDAFYNGPILYGGTTPLDPILNSAGWYGGNSGENTHPVGMKVPNALGLYDIHGNVWEWCWDWYGPYVTGQQTNPRGALTGTSRVRRGGGWSNYAYVCRSASRVTWVPESKSEIIGFRCALNATAAAAASSPNVSVDTRVIYCTITASGENGSVSGAGTFVLGTTALIAGSPAPGYLFSGWTGDVNGTDNPLSVLMDSNKSITATFGQDTNDDDDDGFTNYEEIVIHGTNPGVLDTDGDGVKDSKDAFPLDNTEWLDTDHDGIGDNADTDDDGDGYSDVDEISIYGTNPKRADSDGDGLSDPDEIEIHLTNPNLADTDDDGLSDGAEFLTYLTNPKMTDTDGDGFLDGYEILTGKLPLDPLSKPALVAEARAAIGFTFPAALDKTYRIEDSNDLVIWSTVESGINGNGTQIQRFYTTRNKPMRYFRVEED
jgi:uncharacterized repeat protein (TIGR02543 family)